jgi:hypothetical protein
MDKMLAMVGIQPLFADYVGTANKIIVITPDYKIVKKDLNADGTFSIDLNTSTSSAIFLVNDNTKKVVGSVSIPVTIGSSVTLDMMPKGKITSDLDLGELSFNNGTATSSTVSVEANLGDDNDTKTLASMDDITKYYANKYRNPNYYFMIHWLTRITSNGANTDLENITDQYLTTFDSNISEWQPRFISTASEFEGIDANNIKINFPSNSEDIDYMVYNVKDKDMPSKYAGLTDIVMLREADSIKKTDGSDYGRNITTEPFDGEYTVEEYGVTKAKFDSFSTKPYSTGNMQTAKFDKQPLVLIKLNSDANDNTKISSVSWKFVKYDLSKNKYIDLKGDILKLVLEQSKSIFHLDCELKKANGDALGTVEIGYEDAIASDVVTATFSEAISKNDIKSIDYVFVILGNEYDFTMQFN